MGGLVSRAVNAMLSFFCVFFVCSVMKVNIVPTPLHPVYMTILNYETKMHFMNKVVSNRLQLFCAKSEKLVFIFLLSLDFKTVILQQVQILIHACFFHLNSFSC